MPNVTVGATVACADGEGGHLSALVIDRARRTITHYVVRTPDDLVERMVPAESVASSTPALLQLTCTQAELHATEPFTREESLADSMSEPDSMGYSYPYYGYGYGYGMADVVPPDPRYIYVQVDLVPQGELALREGTDVQATDGRIGSVASLVVDDGGAVSHIVIRQGHAGGRTDLTLPLSAIDHVDSDGVHLKLTKSDVHSLPTLGAGAGGPGHERMQLVAKVFSEPDGADKALEWLMLATHNPETPFELREAAVLVRDTKGKVHIKQSGQPSATKGALGGAGAGALLGLLGPIGVVAGAAVGAAAGAMVGPKLDRGFPDAFLRRLERRLDPGHSALVVLVEHERAQDLTAMLANRENVLSDQPLVDTLVQELLVERGGPQ